MPSSTPYLSIVVPTYNRVSDLLRCLTSILSQTCSESFEIVISDNASTDSTEQFVSSKIKDPRIRYFRNDKNVGMRNNVLLATERAQGQYVLWVTDDDWMTPGALEKLVCTSATHPEAGYFLSHLDSVDVRDNQVFLRHHDFEEDTSLAPGLDTLQQLGPSAWVISRQMFRRECIDWEFWLKHKSNSYFCILTAGRVMLRYPSFYLADTLVMHAWYNELYWEEFGENQVDIDLTTAVDFKNCAKLLLTDWPYADYAQNCIEEWERKAFSNYCRSGRLFGLLKAYGWHGGTKRFSRRYQPSNAMSASIPLYYARQMVKSWRRRISSAVAIRKKAA